MCNTLWSKKVHNNINNIVNFNKIIYSPHYVTVIEFLDYYFIIISLKLVRIQFFGEMGQKRNYNASHNHSASSEYKILKENICMRAQSYN